MTDGYIITINVPIGKSLYHLSFVTYLSEQGQLYEQVKLIGEGVIQHLGFSFDVSVDRHAALLEAIHSDEQCASVVITSTIPRQALKAREEAQRQAEEAYQRVREQAERAKEVGGSNRSVTKDT